MFRIGFCNKVRWFSVLVGLALSLVIVPTALAGGFDLKVGDVQGIMYAPGVVWGGTNAHVIIKLTNNGSKSVDVDSSLTFPEGKEGQFNYSTKSGTPFPKEGITQSIKGLKPGESKYIAFTYIIPKVTAPLGPYMANISLKVDGTSQTIPWNFDVREGTRYQPQTDAIVFLIYGVSIGMLVFWFIYFKGFVNRSFNIFAGEES